MVEPNTGRNRWRRALRVAGLAVAACVGVAAPGGGLVPRNKLDQCHRGALAAELSPADGLALEVSAPADAPPVERAGYDPRPEAAPGVTVASGRFLAAARAARVRDRLVSAAGLDPSRARLAPPHPGADDA